MNTLLPSKTTLRLSRMEQKVITVGVSRGQWSSPAPRHALAYMCLSEGTSSGLGVGLSYPYAAPQEAVLHTNKKRTVDNPLLRNLPQLSLFR